MVNRVSECWVTVLDRSWMLDSIAILRVCTGMNFAGFNESTSEESKTLPEMRRGKRKEGMKKGERLENNSTHIIS